MSAISRLISEVLENASPEYTATSDADALSEIMRVVCRRNAHLPLSLHWPAESAPGPIRAALENQTEALTWLTRTA